jgi:hypothetical protein
MKIFRKLRTPALITLAVLVTAVVIFYLEEDWRGKRAWDACKTELEGRGFVLDWNQFMPPPIPDDQNFFTASTNILIRFRHARTPAETDAAAQLRWLPTSWPDYPSPFNSAKAKPLVVAELTYLPSGPVAGASAKIDQAANFDDPAARSRVLESIEKNVGRSLPGAAGLRLSELQMSNLVPVRIAVRAGTQPAIGNLQTVLSSTEITNLGRVLIEARSNGTMQVLLTAVSVIAAADYLKWSDQFIPVFDEIHGALQRPCAVLPGDYSVPGTIPIPNFVALRAASQILAQRSQCHLLLQDPDAAFREITLLHDLCRILQKPPKGKPETLVEAMINVAISGLYVNAIADGLRMHVWSKSQLMAFQDQLKGINLPYWVAEGFRFEVAASVRTLGSATSADLFKYIFQGQPAFRSPDFWILKLVPRGWYYQNLALAARLSSKNLEGIDPPDNLIHPQKVEHNTWELNRKLRHFSLWSLWARIAIPNATKAIQNTAYSQTLANEAQIACALERYRLIDGDYPASLDVLVPQFIEQPPHDLIGGHPLHYRRTDNGKFVLYSVGWNERDDGGQPGLDRQGHEDHQFGDWVWPN